MEFENIMNYRYFTFDFVERNLLDINAIGFDGT